MEAKVPGDVHLDLLANKLIGDPLYADNATKCEWIEEKTWIYKKNFTVPERFIRDRVELLFKGLDLDAEIFLNGLKVAEHHNAFVPCVVDVTERLRKAANELIVHIDVGKKRVKDKPFRKYYWKDTPSFRRRKMRAWMRKPQFVFGYDWATYLPTCGIWRGVELRSYEKIAVRNVLLRSNIKENKAIVDIEIEIDNVTPQRIAVDLALSLTGNKEHSLTKTVTLDSGLNKSFCHLEVPNPRLWYPQPIGEPFLYSFVLRASMNGKELDSYTSKYGIREVELITEPIEEGESFIFSINKRKVFCKGANWIPADALPANVSKEKYRRLLELAAKANFNMFRIPGLAIYEDPLFYQLCDAHGIMIWQDFMFGNALYPGDDPEFMAEVEREARTIVKQLRNHPSLVLWCGANEMTQKDSHKGKKHYGLVIYRDLLPKICKELDPTRVYRPTSPYGVEGRSSEEAGDRHTGPKGQKSLADYKGYALDRGKFISEFYQYGIPVKESLLEFTPPEQLYVNSPVWRYHNNTGETGIIESFLEKYFIPEEKLSVDEYIVSSQMMQAETFKLALNHWRRRMFTTAGTLFWMYSDCWGTTGGWTIVDYYLRLKPSYFYVKRAFEPVHVSIKQSDLAEVWILNDMYGTYPVDIEYGIVSFRGHKLVQERTQEVLPVAAARLIGRIDTGKVPEREKSSVFCYGRLYSKGELISQDRIFLADFKSLELPEPGLRIDLQKSSDSKYKLTLSSANFAWMVNVELPDGAELSDNCFDMFPGDERQISVKTSRPINLEDIKVCCVNQILNRHRK